MGNAARWVRHRLTSVVALTALLALASGQGRSLAPAFAEGVTQCHWGTSSVASGLGSLENLEFDGTGGLLLSRTVGNAGQLYRLAPDGRGNTLAPNITAPGSIRADGDTAYFTTGNDFLSGLFGREDGTIDRVDLATGTVTVIATGLTMPNGMVHLPDGSFIVSRNLGLSTGLTKITPDGSTETRFAPAVTQANGLTYDPARNVVIASMDLHPFSTLALVDLNNPDHIRRIDLGLLGLFGFPDDLTVGPDDLIYMAMDGGDIVRIDPDHNTACVVASALFGSTSVRFGDGPGWDPNSLYSTDLGGTIHKFIPQSSATR